MSIKQTPEDRATLDLVPQDIKNQMHYDVIKLPIQLEFTNYNNDKISAEPLGYLSRIGDIRQSKIDSDDFCCNIFHILCTSYEPNIDTHDNMVLVCQTGTSLIAYLIDDKKLQHALIQFLTISETDLVSNKDVTQVLEAIIDKTEYSCIITYDNIIQDDLVGKSKSQSNINHTNTSTQNTTTQNTSNSDIESNNYKEFTYEYAEYQCDYMHLKIPQTLIFQTPSKTIEYKVKKEVFRLGSAGFNSKTKKHSTTILGVYESECDNALISYTYNKLTKVIPLCDDDRNEFSNKLLKLHNKMEKLNDNMEAKSMVMSLTEDLFIEEIAKHASNIGNVNLPIIEYRKTHINTSKTINKDNINEGNNGNTMH